MKKREEFLYFQGEEKCYCQRSTLIPLAKGFSFAFVGENVNLAHVRLIEPEWIPLQNVLMVNFSKLKPTHSSKDSWNADITCVDNIYSTHIYSGVCVCIYQQRHKHTCTFTSTHARTFETVYLCMRIINFINIIIITIISWRRLQYLLKGN